MTIKSNDVLCYVLPISIVAKNLKFSLFEL